MTIPYIPYIPVFWRLHIGRLTLFDPTERCDFLVDQLRLTRMPHIVRSKSNMELSKNIPTSHLYNDLVRYNGTAMWIWWDIDRTQLLGLWRFSGTIPSTGIRWYPVVIFALEIASWMKPPRVDRRSQQLRSELATPASSSQGGVTEIQSGNTKSKHWNHWKHWQPSHLSHITNIWIGNPSAYGPCK